MSGSTTNSLSYDHINSQSPGFFCREVTFYILAKTPGTNNHPPSHEDKILKPNLTQFLKYRTKNLNGAHRFIPDYINGILDLIEGISGGIKDDVRQERVNTLCERMFYDLLRSTRPQMHPLCQRC